MLAQPPAPSGESGRVTDIFILFLHNYIVDAVFLSLFLRPSHFHFRSRELNATLRWMDAERGEHRRRSTRAQSHAVTNSCKPSASSSKQRARRRTIPHSHSLSRSRWPQRQLAGHLHLRQNEPITARSTTTTTAGSQRF